MTAFSADSSTTWPALLGCRTQITPQPFANHKVEGPSWPAAAGRVLIRQVSVRVLPPNVRVSKPSKVQVSPSLRYRSARPGHRSAAGWCRCTSRPSTARPRSFHSRRGPCPTCCPHRVRHGVRRARRQVEARRQGGSGRGGRHRRRCRGAVVVTATAGGQDARRAAARMASALLNLERRRPVRPRQPVTPASASPRSRRPSTPLAPARPPCRGRARS